MDHIDFFIYYYNKYLGHFNIYLLYDIFIYLFIYSFVVVVLFFKYFFDSLTD